MYRGHFSICKLSMDEAADTEYSKVEKNKKSNRKNIFKRS